MAKLHHPDSELTIDVNDDMVSLYEAQGWFSKSSKKSAQTTTSAAPAASNQE